MPGNVNRNHRNMRNNPYTFDDLAARLHRTAAGVAWRWRTELAILTLTSAALWRLAQLITYSWAGAAVGLSLIGLTVLPWTRRRFWCVLARHRVQKLCWEARLHTRSGRLPLVLWTRPTKVGERLFVVCRAGICAEDFEAHIGELRAACFAREARATRNRRWSQLVTIDIIRRDTLAPAQKVPSPLHAHRGQLRPIPSPGTPLADTRPLPPIGPTSPGSVL
jgi:hypothetical protein